MSKVKEMVCIVCPNSCSLKVYIDGRRIIKVEGNLCPRGEKYARQELTAPRRMVFSVLKVKNGDMPTVSVKTASPVPKECIPKIMKALSSIEVDAPVEVGQVILKVCGTDIVATRKVRKATEI